MEREEGERGWEGKVERGGERMGVERMRGEGTGGKGLHSMLGTLNLKLGSDNSAFSHGMLLLVIVNN